MNTGCHTPSLFSPFLCPVHIQEIPSLEQIFRPQKLRKKPQPIIPQINEFLFIKQLLQRISFFVYIRNLVLEAHYKYLVSMGITKQIYSLSFSKCYKFKQLVYN